MKPAAPATAAASNSNGEARISMAVLADEHTLLLFGSSTVPLPLQSRAVLEEARVDAAFHAHAWVVEGDQRFLAVLRTADLARHRPGRLLVGLSDGGTLALPRLSNVRLDGRLLLDTLREQAAEALPLLFGFLNAAFEQPDAPRTSRLSRFLFDLLREIATPDGYGEIFGRLGDEGGLMVQGWAGHLMPGQHELLFALPAEEGERLVPQTALVGRFSRSDLPPTAHGFVAALAETDIQPDGIRRIYFQTAEGWRYLETFEGRTLLPDGVATAHLRDMLVQLQGGVQTLKALKKLAHARYEGHDTIGRLDAPVRLALDAAVRVPGAGLFLQGWMLDPEARMGGLYLRGPGTNIRIDNRWARTPRPDVTQAFSGDPTFAGRLFPGMDDHGFMAWVPTSAPGTGRWHLALELVDEQMGFLPVPASPPAPDLGPRLLNALDLSDLRTPLLVSEHVGPLLRAAGLRPAGSVAPVVVEMGASPAAPRISVVVAVAQWREDLDLHLSRMATDPDFADAEVIVAAGPQADPKLAGRLRQASTFFRRPVRLVPVPWARHGVDAMMAALAHVRAPQVLLMGAGVMPLSPGWLSELEQALADVGAPAMVSPTLLYEDFSIRYAGYRQDAGADRPGGLVAAYAGYPHGWLPDGPAAAVDAASPDCVLLPLSLARALVPGAGAYVGAEMAGLDLSLRARAAGAGCYWVPDVRLVAVEEGARGDVPYWQLTGALVDRWMFETAWAVPAGASPAGTAGSRCE